MSAAVEIAAKTPIKDTIPHPDDKSTPVDAPSRALSEHNPKDPSAFYSPDHAREREERQARRNFLREYRNRIDLIPHNHMWEIPGR